MPNYNYGVTSTTMPGASGTKGNRAPITYFTSAFDSSVYSSSFNVEIDGDIVTIYNHQGIEAALNDYIVYSTKTKVYLVRIISKSASTFKTEILDTWENSQEDVQISTEDINIAVTCSNKAYNISNLVESNPAYISSTVYTTSSTTNTIKSFNVVSKNTNPLGTYKIELECVTDLVSPNMDSMIAPKFHRDNTNTGTTLNDSSMFILDVNETINPMSLRGFLNQYDRKSGNGIAKNTSRIISTPCDFDTEYLEKFSLIIKDYTDGVGEMSYATDVTIPIEAIFRVVYATKTSGGNYTYRFFLYIYTKNSDNTYSKQLLGEMSVNDILY